MNASATLLTMVLGAALLASCARTGQAPLPALSTTGRYDNAPILAAFVRRACVDASADSAHVGQILDEIGWKGRRATVGKTEGELSVWRWPHVLLARAQTPVNDREEAVWSCQVAIDGAIAPQINRMETSLRRDVGNRQVFGAAPGDWHWKPSMITEGHIAVVQHRDDSLAISVDYADLKPLKAVFGK